MSEKREADATMIREQFDAILKSCGYVHDPSYNLGDKPEVARKLGTAFFDYMVASIYDTDWEGYSNLEVLAVSYLMQDFKIACDHGLI